MVGGAARWVAAAALRCGHRPDPCRWWYGCPRYRRTDNNRQPLAAIAPGRRNAATWPHEAARGWEAGKRDDRRRSIDGFSDGAGSGGCRRSDDPGSCPLAGIDRLGVAFSGGVDSSVLLALAVRALGADRVVAILGVSPSLAADERAAAHQVAGVIGAAVVEVETHEGDRPEYRANGPDRCFHCKDELFARIGDEVVAGARGSTRSRTGRTPTTLRRPDRPGARAATEHRVLRPLADAGLTRPTSAGSPGPGPARRRQAGRALPGLADPALQEVTPEKLGQIETAEAALRALGFGDLRVRHHGDDRPDRAAGRRSGPARSTEPLRDRCARRCVARRLPLRRPGSGRHPVRRLHAARWSRSTHPVTMLTRSTLDAIADLDHDRAARRGYPEAVYCAGQDARAGRRRSPRAVRDRPEVTLFTRAGDAARRAVLAELPGRPPRRRRRGCWPGRRPRPRRPAGWSLVAGRRHLGPAGRPRGAADRPLPRPADRARGRRRRGRPAPGARPARPAARGPGDRGRRRHGRRAAQRGRRAGRARRWSRCRPRSATARRSGGWPRCWPCSTPAPPASPW